MDAPALSWHRLAITLNQPAVRSHVRAMAGLCFASAGLQVVALLIPYPTETVMARMTAAVVGVVAGAVYWVLADRFRLWMLHLTMVAGASWGLFGVARAVTPERASVLLATVLWTAVLVGAVTSPPVARAYASLFALGTLLAVTSSADGEVGLAIPYAVTFVLILEVLSRLSHRLRSDALTDPLTGLLNRAGLDEQGTRLVALSHRSGTPLSVAQLDLDGFKSVNDTAGHAAGDRILRACADAWRRQVRRGDVLARPGGDEFTVMLAGADGDTAETFLRRLRSVSPTPWTYGLATLEPDDDLTTVIGRADLALTHTKTGRRGAHPAS